MAGDDVAKGLFRSPAGKRNVASRLLPLIPEHKTYVEPFAGSAAVFFRKEPAQKEVLNDLDGDIAFAYRFVKSLTTEKLSRLKRFQWTSSRDFFNRLKASRPDNDVARFHRFLYLNRFGFYGKKAEKASFNVSSDGATFQGFDKLLRGKERLQGTLVFSQDYREVVRRFDSAQTFFFLDPPFPKYDQAVGEDDFDEPAFVKCLRSIKGKFLVTYGIRSADSVFRGFHQRKILVTTSKPEGMVKRGLLLVSNYKIAKSDIQGTVEFLVTASKDPETLRTVAQELVGLVKSGCAETVASGDAAGQYALLLRHLEAGAGPGSDLAADWGNLELPQPAGRIDGASEGSAQENEEYTEW